MFNRRSDRSFTHVWLSLNFINYIHGCEKMDLDKKIEAEEIQNFEGEITAISKIENRRSVRVGKRNIEDKKVVA